MPIDTVKELMDALKDGGRVKASGVYFAGVFEVSGVLTPSEEVRVLESAPSMMDAPEVRGCRVRRIKEEDEWFMLVLPYGQNGIAAFYKVEDVSNDHPVSLGRMQVV